MTDQTLLRTPSFLYLLLTRICAASGLQSQAVIIGWQIYALTRDPLLLGFSGLAEAIPALSCALFAGTIVDRSPPRRVALICLGALTFSTFTLFAIGSGAISLPHHYFLAVAYTAIFLSGVVRSFLMPSTFTLVGQIVPRAHITAATAWMSNGFQAAAIFAPALAGVIYAAFGAKVAWLMPVTCMTLAMTMMSLVHHIPASMAKEMREPMLHSIREGFRFMMTQPVLLGSMSLDMVAVLFGGVVAVLPAFASDVLLADSTALGILRSAPAVGAMMMGLYLAVRPMRLIKARNLLFVVMAFGACTIGFGLSHSLFWATVFLGLSGMVDSISVVIRQTLMQILTPTHLRGRVSSVSTMFIISSNEIGAFESGALAKALGLVPSILAGGGLSIIVGGLTALFSPAMRNTVIDTHAQVK